MMPCAAHFNSYHQPRTMAASLPVGVITSDALLRLFGHTREHGYAIPAFDCMSSSAINAILEAARDAKSSVVIQLSNGALIRRAHARVGVRASRARAGSAPRSGSARSRLCFLCGQGGEECERARREGSWAPSRDGARVRRHRRAALRLLRAHAAAVARRSDRSGRGLLCAPRRAPLLLARAGSLGGARERDARLRARRAQARTRARLSRTGSRPSARAHPLVAPQEPCTFHCSWHTQRDVPAERVEAAVEGARRRRAARATQVTALGDRCARTFLESLADMRLLTQNSRRKRRPGGEAREDGMSRARAAQGEPGARARGPVRGTCPGARTHLEVVGREGHGAVGQALVE